MIQFADEAVITVRSGKGGNGCVSFRREKYIPNGGPNGGDGGRGGDVIFCLKRNLRTLAHLRYHPILKAKNGGDGQGWNRYGKDGDDVVIPVPPGTTIRDNETGELIHDFTVESEDDQFVFVKGGNGGWGNVHFKSSTNQAPRIANKGAPGQERVLRVELSVMADIGLVGFPNAGKRSNSLYDSQSTLIVYPFGKFSVINRVIKSLSSSVRNSSSSIPYSNEKTAHSGMLSQTNVSFLLSSMVPVFIGVMR
mgnify:CR=1 FL=1